MSSFPALVCLVKTALQIEGTKCNASMRVLDLGCGCGLSSFLLAKKYGAPVFAADLWISPTENYERFMSIGIDGNRF